MSELKNTLINISEEVRTKVIPENIKAGVQIFGVDGIVESGLNSKQFSTLSGLFRNNTTITELELDATNASAISNVCNGCTSLQTITITNISKNMSGEGMFNGCAALKNVSIHNSDYINSSHTLFCGCVSLESLEGLTLLRTGNIYRMCYGCTNLKHVNKFKVNASNGKIMNAQEAFANCPNLTDDSLNNIMGMLIDSSGVGSSFPHTRSLATVGLTSEQVTRCQSLPNYEAFIAAGWATGY